MGFRRGQGAPAPTMPWYREERTPTGGPFSDEPLDIGFGLWDEEWINDPSRKIRFPEEGQPGWGGQDGMYHIPEDSFWNRQPIRGPWMPPIMPSPPRGGKGGGRPPWLPPFRPPQRPQMPAFGWISPHGVTPEYRSWMPGMSFAAERSYRNPARPFPIPQPIMPTPQPTPQPPVVPPEGPAYGGPGPGYGPGYGGGGGGGGGWSPGITKAGGGTISPLAQGMATGMAVGGRTGYLEAGEVPDDYADNIGDYYGIGGGGGLAIPPQPGMRSYGAMPSPQGYRPGFDAEWNYFPYSNVPVSAYGQTGQTPYTGNVMGGIGSLAGQGWSGVPYSAYESLFSLPEDFDPASLGLSPPEEGVSPPVETPQGPIIDDGPAFEMPDLSDYVTQEQLQTGLGSLVPPEVNLPDFSQYLTQENLSNYLTDQDLTDFQQGLGSLYEHQGTFDPSDYDWSNIFSAYGGGQGPQGELGLQGPQGELGLQGPQGESGEAFDPRNFDWSDIFSEYSMPFEARNLPYQTTSQLAEIANNAALGVPGYLPQDRGAVSRAGRAGGGKQGLGFSRIPYQALGEVMTEQEVIATPPAQTEVIEETTQVTTEGDEQLIQMAVLAIQGKHPSPDEVQKAFIERFGLDAWIAFRERVLQTAAQNPEATTEGMIEGRGTGMSDEIPGVVAGQEKIAVSPGEFIVPADVVSGIGDGSSDSGSDRLYEMMDRVRQARTGTTEQPRPLNKGGILPA
jgi:hypothetical protein